MQKKRKTLAIRWQRLVDESGRTCPRCSGTQDAVEIAVAKLKKAFAALDIDVELVKETLPFPVFAQDPLASNRVWVGGKPLEEWIGGTAGSSRCCDVCGDVDCRTVAVGSHMFETLPEGLIVKAGLLAAAELVWG